MLYLQLSGNQYTILWENSQYSNIIIVSIISIGGREAATLSDWPYLLSTNFCRMATPTTTKKMALKPHNGNKKHHVVQSQHGVGVPYSSPDQ